MMVVSVNGNSASREEIGMTKDEILLQISVLPIEEVAELNAEIAKLLSVKTRYIFSNYHQAKSTLRLVKKINRGKNKDIDAVLEDEV